MPVSAHPRVHGGQCREHAAGGGNMEVRASGSGSGHDCPLNWVFCPRGTGDVAPKCPLGRWPRWEDEIRIWPPAKLGAHRGQLGVAFARGAVELPAGRGVGGGPSPSDMACGHSRAQRSQPFNWEGQEKHGPCPLHRVSPSPLHHMSPLCSASPPHPLHQVPPTL